MIYLDNAATSFPKPESVYRAMDRVLRRVGGNPGRGGHRLSMEASRIVFRARQTAARIIGADDSSRIAFTKNATEAINIALKGLGLKEGDRIVTTTFEHNSVERTVHRLSSTGVVVDRIRPDSEGFIDPDAARDAIKEGAKVLCMSHASNVFGAIQPLEEIGRICRGKGVVFMVDAAQTLGAVPLDVEAASIDILAATGHKALFGPQGTGFLYVREGIELTPLVDGGTGEVDTLLPMPERLEAGTMNTPGLSGLLAGMEFILDEGVEKIRSHEVALMDRLLSGLSDIKGVKVTGPFDASKRVGLVAFTIEGVDPVEAGLKLDSEFSIMARCGTHCAPSAHREAGTFPEGSIRVSPGYFNTPEEIDTLLEAVETLAGGG